MVDPDDERIALDELYHCNSKHGAARFAFITARQRRRRDRVVHALYEATKGKFTTLPSAPRVHLPPERIELAMTLDLAISGRRSERRFMPESPSLAMLGTLLARSYGVCERHGDVLRRAVPSGGGLYPLDLYVLQFAGGTLGEGVYHYHPGIHALQQVRARCDRATLQAACMYPEIIAQAPLLLAIVADMPRTRAKYGERAYRLALLEAGHVSQNLYLVVRALGLGVVALDGFYDDALHAVLEVDGLAQIALVLFAVGRIAG